MKEAIINGKAKQFLEGKLQLETMVGFTRKFGVELDRHWIWPHHLLRALRPYQIIFGLFLGPAFVLIPNYDELHGQPGERSELNLVIKKKEYVLTREPSSDTYELVDVTADTGPTCVHRTKSGSIGVLAPAEHNGIDFTVPMSLVPQNPWLSPQRT